MSKAKKQSTIQEQVRQLKKSLEDQPLNTAGESFYLLTEAVLELYDALERFLAEAQKEKKNAKGGKNK